MVIENKVFYDYKISIYFEKPIHIVFYFHIFVLNVRQNLDISLSINKTLLSLKPDV